MRTQNLLGMDFCQMQVSGIHIDLPGIELENPPSQSALAAFIRTTPILIYHKF